MDNAEYLEQVERQREAERQAFESRVRADLGLAPDAKVSHEVYLRWRKAGGLQKLDKKPAAPAAKPTRELTAGERIEMEDKRAYESLIRNALKLPTDAPVGRSEYLRYRKKLGLGDRRVTFE
jgi:hypothetical protein